MEPTPDIRQTTTMKTQEIPMIEQMENKIPLTSIPITSNTLIPTRQQQKNIHMNSRDLLISKSNLLFFVALIIALLSVSYVNAQRTASVTGNWCNTATWVVSLFRYRQMIQYRTTII